MIQRVAVVHDARLKKIVLTDQSREFNARMSRQMELIHHRLVDGLTDEEIEFYIQISDKLINNIKNVL